MVTIRSFSHLHSLCKIAAEKAHYPQVIAELHKNIDKKWWDIADSTIIFFLPRAILDLPTKQERRAALDSIPKNTKVSNLRQFVEDGITIMWEKERELDERPRKRG